MHLEGGTIFQRLTEAREAEISALSTILGTKCSGQRAVDSANLIKDLCSAGGNSFRNLFRGHHELPYLDVLRTVAKHVASTNKWKTPRQRAKPPFESTAELWLEEYITESTKAAALRQAGLLDDQGLAAAEMVAQTAMNGESEPDEPIGIAGWVTLGILVPVLAIPSIIAAAADPRDDKLLKAVLVLIAIRKRQESTAQIRRRCKGEP